MPTGPVTADNHHSEAGDVLRLCHEGGGPVDNVVLADAVDHGRVALLRLEIGELESERLLDPDLLLDHGHRVVAILALVQSANLVIHSC